MDETIKTKRCSKCGNELPLTEFHISRNSADGYQGYCKTCKSLAAKESYVRSKERESSGDAKSLVKVYSNPELAKYTPRELMIELKSRGFRWEYMLEPQKKIMYDKLK